MFFLHFQIYIFFLIMYNLNKINFQSTEGRVQIFKYLSVIKLKKKYNFQYKLGEIESQMVVSTLQTWRMILKVKTQSKGFRW